MTALRARTPCCGRSIRLREGVVGKAYRISCEHYPQGRPMTVTQRDDGTIECRWEEHEPANA